jgi:hypothetical protein
VELLGWGKLLINDVKQRGRSYLGNFTEGEIMT